MSKKRWYRYQDGELSEDGTLGFICIGFEVVERTPKGVWLATPWRLHGGLNKGTPEAKTFVLNSAARRFAYSSKEEALKDYKRRKLNQVTLLENQLKKAERLLDALRNNAYHAEPLEKEEHLGPDWLTPLDQHTTRQVLTLTDGKNNRFKALKGLI